MSTPTYIATGSTTLVQSGPGNLYGIHVDPQNGTQVVVIDSLNAGSITSNFNFDPVGLIARIGTYATAVPDFLDFKGVHFNTGLTVAATSTARLTVLTSY